MILDQNGDEIRREDFLPTREPCARCNETSSRELTTGFGGYWKVHCRCGNTILAGRGDPPREGEY